MKLQFSKKCGLALKSIIIDIFRIKECYVKFLRFFIWLGFSMHQKHIWNIIYTYPMFLSLFFNWVHLAIWNTELFCSVNLSFPIWNSCFFFFCLNSMEQTFCFFNSAFTYFTFVSFQDVLTHTFKSAIQLTVRERDFLLNQYRDNTMWFLRLYQNIINGRKERYFLLLGELFG